MLMLKLFKRRAAVAEMVLLSFALGMGSLVCLWMPLLSFASAVFLLLAITALAYGVWLLARPDSQIAYIKYGLTLLGIVSMAGLLAAFGFNVTEYGDKQLQNAVTDSVKNDYMISQLVLFAIQAVAGVVVTSGFYALFKPRRKDVFRLLLLSWATMPLLFALMQLYALILPSDMALLLMLWLGSAALVTICTYILSGKNYVYVGIFAVLTIVTLPIGLTAFALFFFLRSLMPPIKNTPLFAQNDDVSEEASTHPYFARQLKLAGKKLREASAALDAVESSIRKVDPKSARSEETLQVLQAKKAKLIIERNSAEEMYERRLKMQQH